ncbi:precorrin-6Y C5,15-methyltransferase (decarboxylating) subunit CbiT [Dethiobacter alkaliphilus]|uniref:precorrin-6Y C5,15-methyltransferase (decarboxylating) subunit CbiT n=1 Tax=Dethiobacter alkaliphilus TaxID=427926 RepID=UPI0022264B0C|nr:precorrin-6Y C5,15-methyltransferase (decarboxylating) subunit CbiT [Dethiobacter alkaliphilus]MCW3491477.1 precorrin-6Y C5,15-methyltransferase (decarboxylating) subunit CbiT [Dethiobacter alkaliphilus]
MNKFWPYTVPGISDREFTRAKVPMTKEEIRALALCRARLAPGQTVWDVGAGTGSLTVEAALFTPGGRVYAVEKNADGVELIHKNCAKFGVEHVEVISGTAPAALAGLPRPHRVFVGGSGGNLEEILDVCGQKLVDGGIVVLALISPRNLACALQRLKAAPFVELEGIHVQASRLEKLGQEHFFRATNGVWLLSAKKEAR